MFSKRKLLSRLFQKRRTAHLSGKIFYVKPHLNKIFNSKQKIITILIVLIFSSSIGFIQFSGFFNIAKISLMRSSLDLPLIEIEKIAKKIAFGQNIFILDREKLSTAIRELRPDISQIKIQKKYPREIIIEIFKFPIVAKILNNAEPIFINENGFRILDDLPDQDVLTLTLGQKIDLQDSKKQIINPTHLATIRNAISYLETVASLKIIAVKYFPIAREAHCKTELNFDVWLDLTVDFKSQIDKIELASLELDFENKKYEYLDLRPRGKIFFRRKNR
jgi:hypothetical protein